MKKITFFFVGFFFTVAAFSQDLTQHLLLRYPFDGNMNDVSGNGYSGTPFGGVTYGTDRFGNANSTAYFDGIDDYVNFPNLTVLKPNLPVSFSFWINYTSDTFNNQVVFNTSFEENHCTGVWFNSSLSNNGHAANFGNGAYSYSPATRSTFLCAKMIVTNSWHMVTVVVKSTTDMKIYIDCVDYDGGYSGTGGALVYSSTPGCIGRHDRYLDQDPDYFRGYIDDFRYWDKALTAADIAALCVNLSTDNNEIADNAITIYPNPAHDRINIATSLDGIESLTIYNSLGQSVYEGAFQSEIDSSNFSNGIYFIRIKKGSDVLTRKIVIR